MPEQNSLVKYRVYWKNMRETKSRHEHFVDMRKAYERVFALEESDPDVIAWVVPVVVCCDKEIECRDIRNMCMICGKVYNFNGDEMV